MIIIRGTKKFLSFININPEVLVEDAGNMSHLSEWYVNLFYLQRIKCLLFTHGSTLFSFVVTPVRKKDADNLQDLFRTGLSKAMFYNKCPGEMIEMVLKECDGLKYYKTNSRGILASMNQMVSDAGFWLTKAVENPVALADAELNNMPTKMLKYKTPLDQFSELYGFQADSKGVREFIRKESEENLDLYLERELGKDIVDDLKGATPLRIAQELVYQAWESKYVHEAVALAHKALSICPQCADAYNLLANETEDLKRQTTLYLQAVNAGRLALGEKFFEENKGHFWGLIETRPYMRALGGLQDCLWKERQHDNAIKICHDMLRLNEGDNQGMRYVLVRYLMKLSRYDDLERFMESDDYKNDFVAEWVYTRALLWYIKKGDGSPANTILNKALSSNKFVPKYLLRRNFQLKNLPDTLSMGGEDEAQYYAHELGHVWERTPGALEWLKRQTIKN